MLGLSAVLNNEFFITRLFIMKYFTCFIFLVIIGFSACKKEETTVSKSIIVGWGDNLTYGIGGKDSTYLTELAKLTGLQTYNMSGLDETSTQIKKRMLADTGLHIYPTIIWAGRYNTWKRETIKTDIAEMVESLGHSSYLVIGLINADNGLESKGKDNYNRIIAINNDLSETYGAHFIDARTYLISQYDKNNPIDVKDHELDVVPASLRSSILYLNVKGYKMVAGQVNLKIKVLRGDKAAQ
jgi:lambda repressor-like predicted transcriptional regulator